MSINHPLHKAMESVDMGFVVRVDYHDGDGPGLSTFAPTHRDAREYVINVAVYFFINDGNIHDEFKTAVESRDFVTCQRWLSDYFKQTFTIEPLRGHRVAQTTLDVMEASRGTG